MRLFASCAPGLEPLLEAEIRSLGVPEVAPTPGGVELDGDLALLYRLNLELGLAQQVRLRLATFTATKFPALVRAVAGLDFAPHLGEGVPVEVRASARKSRLYHTGAVAERVLEGVSLALGRKLPEPGAPTELPPVVLHARFERDVCTLSLDTSGEPLHRRGYRLESAKAPLREDLARALVVVSGWDRQSLFVDPFVGSGTLPIEAALLARGLPPGAGRRFAFMDAPSFDRGLWERLRATALSASLPRLPFVIGGSDRDEGAVRAARSNAARAGVEGDLSLACAPLGRAPLLLEPPGPRGALVTNPPYGQRVGKEATLRSLYQALGRAVRALPPDYRVALVVADRRLAHATGLRLTSALMTDHGGTKVCFMVGSAGGDVGARP